MTDATAHCSRNGTVTIEQTTDEVEPVTPVVRLRLKKPKTEKKVAWSADTVDNEHLNKKKSKCCCIYEKPHKFDESSSDTDDECEHCRGHVELKKKDGKAKDGSSEPPSEPSHPQSQGL